MRILNITNQIPYPVFSGAPLRTYNVIRQFAKNHEVYLAAFLETEEQRKGINQLLEICKGVVAVQKTKRRELIRWVKGVKYTLQGEPPELKISFSEELAKEILNLAAHVDFDIVQIEHGSMGLYLEVLPALLRNRVVWILHDIDFDKFRKIARIERKVDRKIRAWIHSVIMKRWQPQFAERFGLCITMSEADRRLLLSRNRNLRIEVSPNGVDTHLYQPLPFEDKANKVLFVGNMGYQPNVDAAIYFCGEILPLIRNRINDVELWIVGIKPNAAVKKLEGNGVFVTGGVPDIGPYYGRSKVCVVPLRAGSGTRLKILEAMAIGRPVVSTSIGCEGLDVSAGENIFIANDSKRFAELTVELLRNEDMRKMVAEKAREFVVASYDWDVIARKLLGVYGRMVI